MKSIVVFCGSGSGTGTAYMDAAFELGRTLALQGIQLVYGGARVGLMGAAADGALSAGGAVIGVIPSFLQTKEIAHEGLTELIVVETMHERKLRMHQLSDGIIALPGGFGTMEELFEMLTWGQLGLHRKPMGLLNVAGYYDALQGLVETMTGQGFLSRHNADMLLIAEELPELLQMMKEYEAPQVPALVKEQRT